MARALLICHKARARRQYTWYDKRPQRSDGSNAKCSIWPIAGKRLNLGTTAAPKEICRAQGDGFFSCCSSSFLLSVDGFLALQSLSGQLVAVSAGAVCQCAVSALPPACCAVCTVRAGDALMHLTNKALRYWFVYYRLLPACDPQPTVLNDRARTLHILLTMKFIFW